MRLLQSSPGVLGERVFTLYVYQLDAAVYGQYKRGSAHKLTALTLLCIAELKESTFGAYARRQGSYL